MAQRPALAGDRGGGLPWVEFAVLVSGETWTTYSHPAFSSFFGAIVCLPCIFRRDAQAPLTEVNVNLYAGLSMLVFGGLMLWWLDRSVVSRSFCRRIPGAQGAACISRSGPCQPDRGTYRLQPRLRAADRNGDGMLTLRRVPMHDGKSAVRSAEPAGVALKWPVEAIAGLQPPGHWSDYRSVSPSNCWTLGLLWRP